MKTEILSLLPAGFAWRERIFYFDTIDSTNTHCKALAQQGAPHGTVVLAGHQTGGRGRMGRAFQSPAGLGVYLSVILRPQCKPEELLHLTCAAGTFMCDAVSHAAGFRPGIKWTNDLVFQKRKLGGILTELVTTPQGLAAIVGIGINCNQDTADFDPDIQSFAGSLAMVTGKALSPAALAAAMISALKDMDGQLLTEKAAIMTRYREDCITVGQEVSLVRGESHRRGYAYGIDENGALLVRWPDGQEEAVNSGEISVRGMYGYI